MKKPPKTTPEKSLKKLRTLLTFKDLKARGHPYCADHTRRLCHTGLFPKPIKLGQGPRARNAWYEDEVEAHEAKLAAARDAAE
jgi:hypothetical protein